MPTLVPATVPYFEVVTFSNNLFHGNLAAVCLLEGWPDDRTMLSIASENGATATAFLLRDTEPLALRWFTPVVEEEMCGHGTLGAAWVVLNVMRPHAARAIFETRAGRLTVERESDRYALDLPARTHRPAELSPQVAAALGRQPELLLKSVYYIAVMRAGSDVADLTPNLDLVARLDLPGIIVTAPGDGFGCDVVSRYFAPAKGIPEDPVTGSAHAQIIPYWSQRLGSTTISARQLSRRGGAMLCHHQGDRIRIEAEATLYLQGEIRLPA